MKLSHHLQVAALTASVSLFTAGAQAEVLFKDGFEGGSLLAKTVSTLTSTTGLWNDKAYVTVSSDVAKAGTYAAKFPFTPDNPWCELRFDLGKLNKEVWISFDLYVPTNYYHSSGNNKFIRLWGTDYSDYEKIGISTWPNESKDGFSQMYADWNSTGGGIGPNGQNPQQAISTADRGKWVSYKFYAKAPTSSANGTIKLWKNGALIMDNTNKVNNYYASNTHAYRYGYLLGWANSGYSTNTNFYIDNVVMGTTEADLGTTTQPAVAPPSAPVLRVN